MAGSAIEITVDDSAIQAVLGKVVDRIGDPAPAFEVFGDIVVSSVQENFEQGGRPGKWAPLTESTLKKKNGRGSILVGNGGAADGLLGSIHAEATPNAVYIGTNLVYAATHQFGRPGGGWHGSDIPARPFLMFQEEDELEILDCLETFLMEDV